LIVTADDFGLSSPVNEAIAKAHEKGILTTTSLMVSAPAAEDAVNRAKSLPDLKVGLHLVLSNGKSTLPASDLSALVDDKGEFSSNQVSSGIKMFFNAAAKYQLEKEIRAQFEAFKATGLKLDHVNAHNHMHLHPTVFDLILTIGSEYGLTAIRLPNEVPLESIINDKKDKVKRFSQYFFLKPFISSMKKKCDVRDIKYNEIIYGLHDSGHMNIDKLIRILPHIEEGVTEIYMHPATERWDDIDPAANDYEFEAEYKALIHARTKRAIEKFDITLSGFND
jgi:hopanoid biosynthesis associated protein HpnK